MKIYGNQEILKSGYPDKTQKNKEKPDADFKNILKESVEKSANNPSKAQSAKLMNPVSAIQFNPLSTQDRTATIERLDNLLNLLDNYRQQLANSDVTLRTIEPVMKTIEKEKDQLSAMLESLPNEDGLKDILNQTLITASLEIIKFNRGDYIPS